MSEVVLITSGKGGVGKTTTSANIGTGLAVLGMRVVADRIQYWSSQSGRSHGTGKPHCV